MTRFFAGWLVAGALGLGLAACVPEFESPLAGGDAADPALLGTWRGDSADGDSPMLIDITAHGDGVAVVLRDPKGSTEKLAFTGRTAEAGGVKYISLTPDDAEALGAGEVKVGYLILRYVADGPDFRVSSLDAAALGKAVESGRLKGVVTGSGPETQAKISASADEVAAFLATPEGQAAFNDGEPDDVLILTRAAP